MCATCQEYLLLSFVIIRYLRLSSVLCYNQYMNTYKGQTPARRKANKKYLSEKVDSINVRFPKGMKEILRKRAEKQGLSLNQYCRKAIIDTYIKDSSIADLAIFDTIYKTEIAEFDRKPTTNEENDNADDM